MGCFLLSPYVVAVVHRSFILFVFYLFFGTVDVAWCQSLPDAHKKRVVSLAPHITEMLVLLGAKNKIAAVIDDHDVIGNHQKSRSGFPVIGNASALNLEKILAFHPDLILAWEEGTPPAWIASLRALGLAVETVSMSKVDDFGPVLLSLGRFVDAQERAKTEALNVDAQIVALKKRYRGRKAIRYFYQVWPYPLYGLGADHIVSDGLRLCGAENVVPRSAGLSPMLSQEFVLANNPDVIFMVTDDGKNSRSYWSRFTHLRAVRYQGLIAVNDAALTRPSPAMIDALSQLCQQLDGWRKLREKVL